MDVKIVFLNAGHKSFDDRVFYHQAQSLLNQGFDLEIISTKEKLVDNIDAIKINSYDDSHFNQKQKIKEIIKHLNDSNPQIIIADTPLAILASSIYKRNKKLKIIYDVTEWHPSKKNISEDKGIKKTFKIILLTILNLVSGLKSDYFIFGEHFKSVPFRLLFFWKSYIYLPYYPDLNYIEHFPIEKIDKVLNLTFSGIINEDKGIKSIIESIAAAAEKHPEITFNLRIIGVFPSNEARLYFEDLTADLQRNINIIKEELLPFPEFCKTIGDTHIFLDLRKKDFENSFCLPIKLFYYLACGRPVIYSNLRSIQKEIPDMDFGYLCEPSDIGSISNHIIEYINDGELYKAHCNNALKISRTKFNWKLIENNFVDFVKLIAK